jgi:D-psicose/D-tagatose/L-ribulose 3-epimerase
MPANARPFFLLQNSTQTSITMRFGINTFLYTSPFTTDSVKLFPKFKKWGFRDRGDPVEALEHIDPAKVRAAAEKNGLAIGSVCACMGPGRDFRGSADDQKTANDYVTGLIDQAAALGCRGSSDPSTSVVGLIGPHDDAEKKQQFDLVVKNLKPIASTLRRRASRFASSR